MLDSKPTAATNPTSRQDCCFGFDYPLLTLFAVHQAQQLLLQLVHHALGHAHQVAARLHERLFAIAQHAAHGLVVGFSHEAVAIAPVYSDSGVFLLSADGRGTIRDMQGFNPNKSTGGSGKIAMNTSALVGAVTVAAQDDLFVISRLSKIIRFMAAEVPVKEGVVQGVACMSLRADETTALVASHPA